MPQAVLSGEELKEWVSLGLTAIKNYDQRLWSAIQRINEVPDAPIASEAFNANFTRFEQLFGELCDAEEAVLAKSSMPREKLQRHADDHLGVLEKIHHVHFQAMSEGSLKAQHIYDHLVSEIFHHLIDYHINYEY